MLFKDNAVLFFPDSAHLCRYSTSCYTVLCAYIYLPQVALQRWAPISKENSCRTEPVSRVNSANMWVGTCDSSNCSKGSSDRYPQTLPEKSAFSEPEKSTFQQKRYFFIPIISIGFDLIPVLELPQSDILHIEYWTESQNMHAYRASETLFVQRIKIRLIEGNAKSKKLTCTGTLRQVFILSEAHAQNSILPSHTPPPLVHTG
jgi:hypothetical protein